jgi:hypothetical protein
MNHNDLKYYITQASIEKPSKVTLEAPMSKLQIACFPCM